MGHHVEASVGSTAVVKERRVFNDPKGLCGAGIEQTPVSIIFDFEGCTSFFALVDKATQVVTATQLGCA